LQSLLEEVLGFGILLVVGKDDAEPLHVVERVGALRTLLAGEDLCDLLTQSFRFRIAVWAPARGFSPAWRVFPRPLAN
jgi:hypothetical protein